MPEKILIVDADIDLAHILKEQLRDLNILNVFIATNQEVVQGLTAQNGFDHFFIDFETIAQMDEKELARLVAANASVNIVLMHNEYHAGVQMLQRALGAGYILKRPVRKDDLKKIIRRGARES